MPAEDWDLWIRMTLHGARLGRIAMPGLLYRRHAEQITATKLWQKEFAHAGETAEVHRELSQRLLGFGEIGAYAALTGPWAEPEDVCAAMNLIKAVRKSAKSFPFNEWLSMRATAHLALIRMKAIYGADSQTAAAQNSFD